jgi:hypothetical protein
MARCRSPSRHLATSFAHNRARRFARAIAGGAGGVIAESPLAFPAHGHSIRQYRQALYEFEKERWQRGEVDSHPFDRDIYPPENGKY